MRFLRATLVDGTTATGEFSRLSKVQKYAGQVQRGEKPFNVWKNVGDTLPSGEKAKTRTRIMIFGSQIRSIEEVDASGSLVTEVERGPRGRFTVPEGAPTPLVAGTVYPKHKDSHSLRDYVIVKVASGEGEAATKEQRFYLDTNTIEEVTPEPGDADQDTSGLAALHEDDFDFDGDEDESGF